MSEFKVVKNTYNEYEVYLGDDIRYTKETIAFLYDFSNDGAVLLKHGDPSFVREYFNKVIATTENMPYFTESMMIIETDDLPCSEVEKMLNCSGYLTKELKDSLKNK